MLILFIFFFFFSYIYKINIDELRKLLKEKGVTFYSYWNKQRLIELAKINDLLPKEEEEEKGPEEENPKYVNYERLKNIRHTPTKVILKDVETEEEHTFPSIYKAAQYIDKSPQTIRHWRKKNGVWNKKYKVCLE